MRQPCSPQSKIGFLGLGSGENPRRFLFLKPNPLLEGIIAKISLENYFFFRVKAYYPIGKQQLIELRAMNPNQATAVVMDQGKG
jgi:hypothetical protein